jgi:hypothetical protein
MVVVVVLPVPVDDEAAEVIEQLVAEAISNCWFWFCRLCWFC